MSEKAVVIVCYGTSQQEPYEKAIVPLMEDYAQAFPDRDVKLAFSSKLMISRAKSTGFGDFRTVGELLDDLAEEGYKDVLVQPTQFTAGGEYAEVRDEALSKAGSFDSLKVSTPILKVESDYDPLVEALAKIFIPMKEEMLGKDSVLVLMGHGAEGLSNGAYSELAMKFRFSPYKRVFVTTLERFPSIYDTEEQIRHSGCKDVLLAPLLMFGGKHLYVDMAGDGPESLTSILKSKGYNVVPVRQGLAQFPEIRRIFVEHAKNAC